MILSLLLMGCLPTVKPTIPVDTDVPPGELDSDNDGVPDDLDNCPFDINTNQNDRDGDGVGNVCDNCPEDPNANQADSDGDGIGNRCDDGGEADADADADSDADADADADADSDADADTDPLGLGCPPSSQLTTLGGAPGGFGSNTFTWTWSYDSSNQISFGPTLYANVPNDMWSVAISVDAGFAPSGVGLLATDDLLIMNEVAPPYTNQVNHVWYQFAGGGIVLPQNANTFPQAGCLAFLPLAVGNVGGQTGTAHLSGRRFATGAQVLDLNIIVVDGTEVYQNEIDATIAVMSSIYANNGAASIGTVQQFSYTNPSGNVLCTDCADLDSLRAVTTGSAARTVNIFLISDFLDQGVLGIAGGIPGALGVEGLGSSGVVVAVDPHLDGSGQTLDADLMGATFAHEVGHQIGLFHTSESTGTFHDPIADTPQCPASRDSNGDGVVLPSECNGFGSDNVMFWSAGGAQTTLSPTQRDILYFSPVVR
ncbi:MAG: thrombospondin type 3 repeat-containing protein [Myxococcota bacterium]